jgi:hypothetical protein
MIARQSGRKGTDMGRKAQIGVFGFLAALCAIVAVTMFATGVGIIGAFVALIGAVCGVRTYGAVTRRASGTQANAGASFDQRGQVVGSQVNTR